MEKREFAVNKIAELLEVLGGTVQLHVGAREGQVLSQMQRAYDKLPDVTTVLQIPNGEDDHRYVPMYGFVFRKYPDTVYVNIYGNSFTTREEAQRNVDFWRPTTVEGSVGK